MYLKGAWDDCISAYETLEEAIAALEEELIEYGDEDKFESPDSECSLGIGIDEDGKYWFAVSIYPNTFISMQKDCLSDWQDWYEDEWVERELERDDMKNEIKVGNIVFATDRYDFGLFFWGKPINKPFNQWIRIAEDNEFNVRFVKHKEEKIKRYIKNGRFNSKYHNQIMQGIQS